MPEFNQQECEMTQVNRIRPAAVAGRFYPGEADHLASTLKAMLAAAHPQTVKRPKALIVPHAGYVYSGSVAASAYALLRNHSYRRVVVFGPAHRMAVEGLAVPEADGFATPLGVVPIDRTALQCAPKSSRIETSDLPHAEEHSIEVQLPFLQHVLGTFELVPILVGWASDSEVAAVMDALWDGDDTLIVVSSDLSHYHPYDEARRLDHATVQAILNRKPLTDHEQACGATGINALIQIARDRQLSPHLLDLRNSGDTGDAPSSDRGQHSSQVVGYAAIAFTESAFTEPDTPHA
jgi:AmmeMemoRadiSam system protein B